MITPVFESPAEQASRIALETLYSCIQRNHSFVFEAGAGAGKTYSLVKALRYLIENKANELSKKHQHIACITYTKVATEEISSRIDGHPVVFVSTIHSFCWNAIQLYQEELRQILATKENWQEKIESCEVGVQKQRVLYDLGHASINEERIYLGHNDVIVLASDLMTNERFRTIFTQRFPILFIDEFQDTDTQFFNSLLANFIVPNSGPLIGFFGDHWQKIYPSGCGDINHENLVRIGKRANFRSVSTIVNMLNAMRPELTQEVEDDIITGQIDIFHTNSWRGNRRTGAHWQGDLPVEEAKNYLSRVRTYLGTHGWSFLPEHTKILMLTHKVLADEQGYRELIGIFEANEEFVKKENPHIKFFVEVLEPICEAYSNQKYGIIFSLLGSNTIAINSHQDKLNWANSMQELIRLRENGTIGDIITHLKNSEYPRLPKNLYDLEDEFLQLEDDFDLEELSRPLNRLVRMRNFPYTQVISLSNFINDKTPFATKHSVKGTEYENVLVVIGRGWSKYNFNLLLEQFAGIPVAENQRKAFEENRNLFYVACSRPKKRLALLFTQELSTLALGTLTDWCGQDNIHDCSLLND